ncbi:hypothetical protein BC832DRAFT_131186 [Gaertneriomyces semiglobifer]|nr:hypothetical protein BC832DRAFT_131186 [Gaertneriomyces semiglobifer]
MWKPSPPSTALVAVGSALANMNCDELASAKGMDVKFGYCSDALPSERITCNSNMDAIGSRFPNYSVDVFYGRSDCKGPWMGLHVHPTPFDPRGGHHSRLLTMMDKGYDYSGRGSFASAPERCAEAYQDGVYFSVSKHVTGNLTTELERLTVDATLPLNEEPSASANGSTNPSTPSSAILNQERRSLWKVSHVMVFACLLSSFFM